MILLILVLLADLVLGVFLSVGVVAGETPLDRVICLLLVALIVGNIWCMKLAKEGGLSD